MARWQVIDPTDDGVVFSAESIHGHPVVRAGMYTPRAWAILQASANTDPEAPEPLRAVKVAA